jgi:hypothetical protein
MLSCLNSDLLGLIFRFQVDKIIFIPLYIKNGMRSLFWILPLFLIPSALAYPTATAQNMTNTTGNGTESGGMSSESVESAQSNTTGGTATNTTGNGTESGGMSSESVESAK